MKQRALNLLIALDQFLWVLITMGNGSPDETISAACWRMDLQGKWQGRLMRPLIDGLFFFDPDHCRVSFESEQMRSQLPNQYQIQEGANHAATTE